MNKRALKTLLLVLLFALFFASWCVLLASFWLVDTWGGLSLDEIIFHLKAPMEGANYGVAINYLTHYVLPGSLVLILAVAAFIVWRKHDSFRKTYVRLLPVATALLLLVSFLYLNFRLGIIDYIKVQSKSTDFIEVNYVDPNTTKLEFPYKKRNLIYIYLESAEVTYSDRSVGGAFDVNVIPELTDLAMENECFAGDSGKLNGAVPLYGSTWTMGAMFAHTSGLPLKMGIANEDIQKQDSFFPSLTTLGDILEDEGYTNELLIGSSAAFGGRQLYFGEHGNYVIRDYYYAKRFEWIPKGYKEWWGFEDEKLFEFAKQELGSLSESGEPFNLTLLTVDTHFEDGYVCRLCGNEHGDNQYANIFSCSSRQVASFVEWCSEQDFYENTTIILVGDHLTMDKDFCQDVPSSYDRKVYLSIINAPVTPEDPSKTRLYSTMDMFPTTLASLGVKIEGDRLGLGTNLFSSQKTMLEEYGITNFNNNLGARSTFMEDLGK